MSFSRDWLRLRAPADARARDVSVLAALGAFLARRPSPLVVELGCGAGALATALGPWLPVEARFRLSDNDPALLEHAKAAHPNAETRQIDLNDHAALCALIADADVVVASAFFDLVSADWMDHLVAALSFDAGLYAALTFDGREHWEPAQPEDAKVTAAFVEHMQRDKGLGVALGASAGAALAQRLKANGRPIVQASALWRLSRSQDGALMDQLADGIAAAVGELGVDASAWRAAERTGASIGHLDLFAGARLG